MASKDIAIGPCSPFFIVADIEKSLEYYVNLLGFECIFKAATRVPDFAIVARGTAQLMFKEIGPDVPPLANHQRHEWARWDAFIYTPEPDTLFEEFRSRSVAFFQTLSTDDDGLLGFAVADPDSYISYFGRPE